MPANYNSKGQIVISGHSNAVESALSEAKEQGAKLAKLLPVSGAFHSSLMQPAYDEFKLGLDKVSFANAIAFPIPLLPPVTRATFPVKSKL